MSDSTHLLPVARRTAAGRAAATAGLLLVMAAAPAAGAAAGSGCGPSLTFAPPVFVDSHRSGGEPVVQTVADGSLVLAAHAGTTLLGKDPHAAAGAADFAAGYANQVLVWRSTDQGRTWAYNGLSGLGTGPHSVASSGFSDPDLTIDSAGRVYGTEINLANISVFSSTDHGRTWPESNPVSWIGDRPWITATTPGTVYLYVQSPLALLKSTDAGRTFHKISDRPLAGGKLHRDPLRPTDGLIAPLRGGGAAISTDGGHTWTPYPLRLGKTTAAFDTLAVDQAGSVYAAHAGGYTGPGDTRPDGEVTVATLNRRTGQWSAIERLNTPPGDALWPWFVAHRPGNAAVVWLHRPAGTNGFHIYAAASQPSGNGCTGRGPTRLTWTVVDASRRPVHSGHICSGTNCNLDITSGGDRRLGDFISATTSQSGKLVIASGDTTLTSPTGGPKPVANPIVIVQR